MKVVVDLELCEGNAKCSAAAPNVFEVRDDDRSYVLLDPVPEAQRAAVERAARLCPRAAITVQE
jgi:ferredoxin